MNGDADGPLFDPQADAPNPEAWAPTNAVDPREDAVKLLPSGIDVWWDWRCDPPPNELPLEWADTGEKGFKPLPPVVAPNPPPNAEMPAADGERVDGILKLLGVPPIPSVSPDEWKADSEVEEEVLRPPNGEAMPPSPNVDADVEVANGD